MLNILNKEHISIFVSLLFHIFVATVISYNPHTKKDTTPPISIEIRDKPIDRPHTKKDISRLFKLPNHSYKDIDIKPTGITSKSSDLSKINNKQNNEHLSDVMRDNKEKYSSFFDRIGGQLDSVWRFKVRYYIVQYLKETGRSLHRTTVLIITLNANGELISVLLQNESGNEKLDQIAINAFKELGNFPNPPKELVKNGLVVFDWTFIVY